ncbi:MAG: hypothetical protein LCH79_10135 [Proteobacteria bacterium]|jgi:hypothetical protein|nr:hypothetical protein [Ramlibacter sp.]MCA0213513.1 hypothetical protein [Pseudomonadota bacterium]
MHVTDTCHAGLDLGASTLGAYSVQSLATRLARRGGAFATSKSICSDLFRRCLQSGDLVAWNSLAEEIDIVRQTLKGMPLFEIPGSSLLHRLAILDQNLRTIKAVCLAETPLETANEKRVAIDQGVL